MSRAASHRVRTKRVPRADSCQAAAADAVELALIELERAKSEFLSNTSHELRTPLATIVGYAEFLEDELGGPLTAEQRVFVCEIQAGAERLRGMIDNMLDMARVEAKTFELARQETDLTDIAREGASRVHGTTTEAGLELELDLPSGPLFAHVDPERISRALEHLLANAIRFTPAGGRVVLRLRRDGACARFEVHDSGIGIPAAQHHRLFEKFFQGDGGSTRVRQGAGVGLFIARALVEAHGGGIGFESVFGDGSVFWFTLPLSVPVAEPVLH